VKFVEFGNFGNFGKFGKGRLDHFIHIKYVFWFKNNLSCHSSVHLPFAKRTHADVNFNKLTFALQILQVFLELQLLSYRLSPQKYKYGGSRLM
jgi:hypothetical protein